MRHGRERRKIAQMIYHLDEIIRRKNLRPPDIRSLLRVGAGQNELRIALIPRRYEQRQNAVYRTQRPVERQFAPEYDAVRFRPDELFARLQEPDRDGKIEEGAFLFDIRGGEIDGYLPVGKFSGAVFDGGAHALFGFLDSRVRKPDQLERGQAVIDVRFHGNGHPRQPAKRETRHFRQHDFPPLYANFPAVH